MIISIDQWVIFAVFIVKYIPQMYVNWYMQSAILRIYNDYNKWSTKSTVGAFCTTASHRFRVGVVTCNLSHVVFRYSQSVMFNDAKLH